MQILKDELQKSEYQNLTDRQAADLINSKTITIRRRVDCGVVKQHAIENGYFADIEEGCISTNQDIRKLCKNVKAWIDDPSGKMKEIDMDAQSTINMINFLLYAGLITQEWMNELKNLANYTILWVDYIGVGKICDGTVKDIRSRL